jgi:hypothetical protein
MPFSVAVDDHAIDDRCLLQRVKHHGEIRRRLGPCADQETCSLRGVIMGLRPAGPGLVIANLFARIDVRDLAATSPRQLVGLDFMLPQHPTV